MPRRASGTTGSSVTTTSAQPRLVGARVNAPKQIGVGQSAQVSVAVTNKATILNPDDEDYCEPSGVGGNRGYELETGLEITSAPGDTSVTVDSVGFLERVIGPGGGGGGSPGPATAQVLCVPNTFGTRTAQFSVPAQPSDGTIKGRAVVYGFSSDNKVAEESFEIQVGSGGGGGGGNGRDNNRNNNGGDRNTGGDNSRNNGGSDNKRRDTGSDNSDDSGDEEDPFAGTPLEDLSREERLAVGAGGAALLIALSGRR